MSKTGIGSVMHLCRLMSEPQLTAELITLQDGKPFRLPGRRAHVGQIANVHVGFFGLSQRALLHLGQTRTSACRGVQV